MMNDSLILVHLYPYVSISLPRYSSGLDKIARLLIHVIATLSSGYIMLAIIIQPFLPPAHRLVVELSALLLKLIVTNIKSVPA